MSPIDIVIVEDDPMVVEVNCGFVKAIEGFDVVGIAGTGKEALALIKKLLPSLTLLDIYLPDMNGITLLQEIRKLCLPTDVILVTAAHDAQTIQNSFRYGAIDYIIKPFKITRLQFALKNYQFMKKILNEKTFLVQEELDILTFKREIQDNEIVPPKGLNDITLKQILLHLFKQMTPLSSEEVAAGLGLARVTARRYLEYLCLTGMVGLELQYGSVGRPVKKYKIT
jgi:two-component system response regulator DctR